MKIFKSLLLLVLFLFNCFQNVYAFTNTKTYTIQNTNKTDVYLAIKSIIREKNWMLLADDKNEEYISYQPLYCGVYISPEILILMQDNKDVIMYGSTNGTRSRTVMLMSNALQKKGYSTPYFEDKRLEEKLDKLAKSHKIFVNPSVMVKNPQQNNYDYTPQQQQQNALTRFIFFQSLANSLNNTNNLLNSQQQMRQTSELMQINSNLRQMQFNQNRQTNYLPSTQPQTTVQRIYVPYTQSTTQLGNPIYKPINSNYSPISVPQRVFNNY